MDGVRGVIIMATVEVITMGIAMATTGVTLRVQKRVIRQVNAVAPQTMFIRTETAELNKQATTGERKPGIIQVSVKASLPVNKTICTAIKEEMFISRVIKGCGNKNLMPGLHNSKYREVNNNNLTAQLKIAAEERKITITPEVAVMVAVVLPVAVAEEDNTSQVPGKRVYGFGEANLAD